MTTVASTEQSETGSGVGAKQRRTSRLLTARARELTAADGLAGFTVQRLCDEVGISRRTFFNYFPSKEDAVIGIARGADDEHVARFLASRSGDLLTDLVDLAVDAFDDMALTQGDVLTMKAVLEREPSLVAIMLRSAQQQQERFVTMVAQREELGSDRAMAEVAVKVVGALIELSAHSFFADVDGEPFDVLLRRRLAAASILLENHTTHTHLRPKDLVTTP